MPDAQRQRHAPPVHRLGRAHPERIRAAFRVGHGLDGRLRNCAGDSLQRIAAAGIEPRAAGGCEAAKAQAGGIVEPAELLKQRRRQNPVERGRGELLRVGEDRAGF